MLIFINKSTIENKQEYKIQKCFLSIERGVTPVLVSSLVHTSANGLGLAVVDTSGD